MNSQSEQDSCFADEFTAIDPVVGLDIFTYPLLSGGGVGESLVVVQNIHIEVGKKGLTDFDSGKARRP